MKWEWYDDLNTKSLFLHCLLKANHEPKQWRGITIERGQFVTSTSNLAKEIGVGVQAIRTCINRLKSTSEITSQSTSRFTILTICNYDSYQSEENPTNKPTNKPSNKRLTNEQQATNKQLTTTKELKEEKNNTPLTPQEGAEPELEKSENPAKGKSKSGPKAADKNIERFEKFWKSYPRKIGKGQARKVWLRLKPNDELTDTLVMAVEAQKKSEQWQKSQGQFIPHPTTWLNQERWEDEISGTGPGEDNYYGGDPPPPIRNTTDEEDMAMFGRTFPKTTVKDDDDDNSDNKNRHPANQAG